MTHLNPTNPRAARLWALEPAVAPTQARYALVFGALFGTILIGLSQGPLPQNDLEEWHGNVAVSHTLRPE